MTIKDKLDEAILKNESFYIPTPTYEIFEKVVNLFKNDFLEYVPYATFKYNNWNKNTWDKFGVTTNIYYIKSDKTVKFGNDVHKNDGYCLNLLDVKEEMTIKDKLEEALIKGENFYVHTPDYKTFEEFINLCKNYFRKYVPKMQFEKYDFDMWNNLKENTYLFYWKDDFFAYGGKGSINRSTEYFLDLFNLKEEIQEHTYTISIGEYSGKLIIPKEALNLLKQGIKIKFV